MKLDQILTIESQNRGRINLFRQGVFWKAFEKSCVALRDIEEFKITKRYSPKLKQEYIYSGFPDATLDRITLLIDYEQHTTEHISFNRREVDESEMAVIKNRTELTVTKLKQKNEIEIKQACVGKVDEIEFETQKKAEVYPLAPTSESEDTPQKDRQILELVKLFDTKKSTPEMCKLFVGMIQSQL